MTQMFTHTLNPVHGGGLGPAVKTVPLAASTRANAYAGRVGYLNDNGELVVGAPSTKKAMPLFIMQGIESPSVYMDVDTSVDKAYIVTSGRVNCAVATGGWELQTTEFVTGGGNAYPPNTPLTVHTDGKLKVGTIGTDWIVGMASLHESAPVNTAPYDSSQRAVGLDANRQSVLNLWTLFIPGSSS